jgi:prepilin-type N-terminal cleavage/methylation domain-containing protein
MQRFRRKNGQKGFTMIELMVVVVIVGVLAGIAIPIYAKYIKNARLTEATGRMGEIITAAKAFALEHQNPNATWPTTADVTAGCIVDLTASQYFAYTLANNGGGDATAVSLTVHAAGIAGGKMANVTVDITVPDINKNGNAPVVGGL